MAKRDNSGNGNPSNNGKNGRRANGKFAPGNKLGKGRPPGIPSLSTELQRHLNENPKDKAAIIQEVIKQAKSGDLRAVELVWDRTDGKPTQHIDANVTERTVEIVDPGDFPERVKERVNGGR